MTPEPRGLKRPDALIVITSGELAGTYLDIEAVWAYGASLNNDRAKHLTGLQPCWVCDALTLGARGHNPGCYDGARDEHGYMVPLPASQPPPLPDPDELFARFAEQDAKDTRAGSLDTLLRPIDEPRPKRITVTEMPGGRPRRRR